MPSKKSGYADLLRDGEKLLDACDANGDLLPGMDLALAPLAKALERVKELRDTQEGLLRARRRVTELLRETRGEALESARHLRRFVKSRVGSKSERLREFGIVPLRSRRKSKKK
jgi:hypothetical protein